MILFIPNHAPEFSIRKNEENDFNRFILSYYTHEPQCKY